MNRELLKKKLKSTLQRIENDDTFLNNTTIDVTDKPTDFEYYEISFTKSQNNFIRNKT